jgi:hypothetical protein
MSGIDIDYVVARLLAGTTSLGASAPGVPGVYAINGARVGVAVLLSRNGITRLATVGNIGDDRLRASLNSAATDFGAGSPGSPAGKNTVDGTGLCVADAILRVKRALNTTMGDIGDDGPHAGLAASCA